MPGVIIFDPNDNDVGFSTGDDQANAVFLDKDTGNLFIADLDTIYEWEGSASPMTATWRSGTIRLARKVNMGAALIEADEYTDIVMSLFAQIQGVMTLITTITVVDGEPLRLPGGYLSNLFEVQIVTTNRIQSVSIAESVFDLKAG